MNKESAKKSRADTRAESRRTLIADGARSEVAVVEVGLGQYAD